MSRPKKTIKFIHVADVHLGKNLYKSDERSDDFFYALKDVIEKHAIPNKIDFFLIAGDFFDVRKISSKSMNQAVVCLDILKQAKIPVYGIEGNHDSREYEAETSWLRSLSKWGFLKLLEPAYHEDRIEFLPWDEESKTGSYVDLGNIRIFGNTWMGSLTSDMLVKINDSLRDLYDPEKFNIMMLHADIEGQLSHPIKGVSVDKLTKLKTYINYLALGHIHKNFEIADFAYNPGGLENATVDEAVNKKGAYLVTVTGKKHKATLIQNYRKRPVIRLKFDLGHDKTAEDFAEDFFAFLRKEISPHVSEVETLAPVLEITIKGTIGFKTSLLNLNKIREEIKKEFQPLLVILKNHTIPVDISSPVSDNLTRKEKERQIIGNLVSKDPRFKDKFDKVSDVILELKKMVLSGESAETIAETIEKNI